MKRPVSNPKSDDKHASDHRGNTSSNTYQFSSKKISAALEIASQKTGVFVNGNTKK